MGRINVKRKDMNLPWVIMELVRFFTILSVFISFCLYSVVREKIFQDLVFIIGSLNRSLIPTFITLLLRHVRRTS